MSRSVISLERSTEAKKAAACPLEAIVSEAAKVIAPLWPISAFIARHPWMGMENKSFVDAADRLQEAYGIDLYPPMAVFHAALSKGEIDVSFIERRLQRWLDDEPLPAPRHEAERLCRALLWNDAVPEEALQMPKLIELAAAMPLRSVSIRTRSVRLGLEKRLDQQMIKWCKLFYDRGEAVWALPHREHGFYGSWRRLAPLDPSLSKEERKRLFDWPHHPEEALQRALEQLGVQDEEAVAYLEAHLLALPGWAGMMVWQSRRAGDEIGGLINYLAVRLSLEWVFTAPHLPLKEEENEDDRAVGPLLAAWIHWGGTTLDDWRRLPLEDRQARLVFADRFWRIGRRHLWLEAWEDTYEAKLKEAVLTRQPEEPKEQAAAQLLFCIDVRSEPFRRHVEAVGPFETYGCAGFFGLPIQTRVLDSDDAHPSCPAIVAPRHEINETASPETAAPYRRRRDLFRFVGRTFKKIKQHLLAGLLLPEMSGPWLGLHTIARSAAPAWAGQAIHQAEMSAQQKPKTTLSLDCQGHDETTGLPIGLTKEEQVQYVKQLLVNIGLTSSFAPLVVVCGHESETTNNPYASALDCGACGGAAGAFNARVFAALANLPHVRDGLAKEGIVIPDETVFVAAEHITTVDELRWVEVPPLSEAAEAAFRQLKQALAGVSRQANAERMAKLPHVGAMPRDPVAEARRRAVDWSEIRPEWGLAGNAAFLIGRRALTKGVHLDGRVFLHSYDWREDPTGEALAGIIAGPATVGQWINLQYYASTVAPNYYGSGDKTTQTVTGGIGVMQGNGSDLLAGLPWQSVAASDREWFHSPLRLLVIIEAPFSYIERLLDENSEFRRKVQNGWLRLASIDPDSGAWVNWEAGRLASVQQR
ncbi:DUF2309 domain-containing protein [Geobacillus kaustophilus NBRC 102445]|uniref:DUF2309 domain-containing protein n=2 Tax=Geobacillus thermoleovorans group TaxID=1505648 RepID=UPI0005A9E72E|nr:DUF2309 domain-containing protein [Geobacillus kaustophilus]QCK81822.1 DUF2309 domain-containing protein [Geobacillus kaustophilus NBRC 102445]